MTFHIIQPLAAGQASKEISQEHVTALLLHLEALKKEVAKARQALAPLEANLALAEKEYQEQISPLRHQANRLQLEINEIHYRMISINPEPPSDEPDDEDRQMVSGIEPELSDDLRSSQPINLEMLEKDRLLEHAYRVLDAMINPDDALLIGQLTGWSTDEGMTLGDLLEELSWGTVWVARSQQETLAEQYERLTKWEQALIKQGNRLNKGTQRMRRDRRYRWWQKRQKGAEVWQSYLSQEAKRYQQNIKRLQRELEEWEEEWNHTISIQ